MGQCSKQAFLNNSIGFGFSAGGYLFPYYVGLAFQLERLRVLKRGMCLAGSSAGSLIASCYNAGLSEQKITDAVLELAQKLRKTGTFGNLSKELKIILEKYIPDDAHIRCSGNTFLGVTKIRPNYEPKIISQFASREDLINTMMVSCHIPLWSDKTYTTKYRDGQYFDGGFSNFIPAPDLENLQHTVKVCCYPLQALSKTEIIAEISPDLYKKVPLTLRQIARMSFTPGTDKEIMHLIEMGRQNAQMWYDSLDLEQDDPFVEQNRVKLNERMNSSITVELASNTVTSSTVSRQ